MAKRPWNQSRFENGLACALVISGVAWLIFCKHSYADLSLAAVVVLCIVINGFPRFGRNRFR